MVISPGIGAVPAGEGVAFSELEVFTSPPTKKLPWDASTSGLPGGSRRAAPSAASSGKARASIQILTRDVDIRFPHSSSYATRSLRSLDEPAGSLSQRRK